MNLNLDPLKHRKILSARFKIGYSFAESGINATELLLRLYLLSFYTDIVGISPFWAGLAGFIGLFWDAVTDPLMGKLSDRTLKHFKGRSPYLFFGTLILATPTLAKILPPPVRKIIGDLSDREKVLIGLDLLFDELTETEYSGDK